MKIDTYKLEIVFMTPILGSQPTKDVLTEYISKKTGFSNADEMETLPDTLDKGTTVFHKDDDDRPLLWNYQVKGFLKAAAQTLNGRVVGGVKNLRSKVDANVFVSPRRIEIRGPNGADVRDLIDYLERPLRAQTAQGDRVALARSEMLPESCTVQCGLEVIAGEITQDVLEDLLDYGALKGIGQWRNGGFGSFRYTLTKEDTYSTR